MTNKPVYISLTANHFLPATIPDSIDLEKGKFEHRRFPDDESYIRIDSNVENRELIVHCTLDRPDRKFLPLYFLCQTAKDLGAAKISLIAPYLAYMRQDRRFSSGEGITSEYFAGIVSQFVDGLITVDPHLHRYSTLSEIYDVPTEVTHAAPKISDWIRQSVEYPLLIGPDSESEQWVSSVAEDADAPFLVLEKTRKGDREVEVSVPDVDRHKQRTPVLVDDIISTGRTMVETTKHLRKAGLKSPVCAGVHAVFAGDAEAELKEAGIAKIVTCNTIPHKTNSMDVTELLVQGYNSLYE